MLPEIDFKNIRILENSKNKGFEELCVQLFRSLFPDRTQFYRVDDTGGDGGVEDFANNNGKKIGMQAKYFDKLGTSQWSQINKSVKTALLTHSAEITQYYIFTPVNRRKKITTWTNYIKKWNDYAASIGYSRTVEFKWFGETEIRELLLAEKHREKVFYWFGVPQFSEKWIEDNFKIAIKNLDSRYTPDYHVKVETENMLDAFLVTEEFKSTYLKKIKEIIKIGQRLIKTVNRTEKLSNTLLENLNKNIQLILSEFDNNNLPEAGTVNKLLNTYKECLKLLYGELHDLNFQNNNNRLSYEMHNVNKAIDTLDNCLSFIYRFSCYNYRKLLLSGEAGSGKSHLLALCVKQALNRGQPALLVLGDQFTSRDEPFKQLIQNINWNHTLDELLSVIDMHARITGAPALIAIDACNESSFHSLWRLHLNGFASKIANFPEIRLIVSCREDFLNISIPKNIIDDTDKSWIRINHFGFGEQLFEAIHKYFKGYNVKCDHFPPILEEFNNPLFLKTFCEAFSDDYVPPGPLSFDLVMKKRLKRCETRINQTIGCPEYKIKKAINLISKEIALRNGASVPHDDIRPQIDDIFFGNHEAHSLYIHLRSNGLIVETLEWIDSSTEESRIMVRFPYERFADYFIVDNIFRILKTKEKLLEYFQCENLISECAESLSAYYNHRGILRMLAILTPERFGLEFIEVFNDIKHRVLFLEDFLHSLPWREKSSFSSKSNELLKQCIKEFNIEKIYEHLFKIAIIPDHPFNANYLHEKLKSLELNNRELEWTIPITNITSSHEDNIVNQIILWCFRIPVHLISDQQVKLVALLLTWMLGSNYRLLRKRVSIALIRILQNRSHIVRKIIQLFHNCNDPYIVERVYAVTCGVTLREKDQASLKNLAVTTYKYMFEQKPVPPHILQREYAQSIIEYANYRNSLPEKINLKNCIPPFHSDWPRIISEETSQEIENTKGWSTIKRSVQPEETGYYGDFGRYIMDYYVSKFSRKRHEEKEKLTIESPGFSGMTSKRWIIQRIKELDWTPEQFNFHEDQLVKGRLRVDEEENKIERISKKYQWIALYELLGYLSDNYRMSINYYSDEETQYYGAWQIGVRDFDPTQPLIDPIENGDNHTGVFENDNKRDLWWFNYPDPFGDSKLRFDREKWVTSMPDDFSSLILHKQTSEISIEWLTLSGHYDWKENLSIAQIEAEDGQLKMWTNLRSWLVKKEFKEEFIERIINEKWYGNLIQNIEFCEEWIGEYPWASSLKDLREDCNNYTDRWIKNSSITAMPTVCCYNNENSSIEARLPSPYLFNLLKLQWTGENVDFIDNILELTAYCPNYLNSMKFSSPLLVNKQKLLFALNSAGLEIVWGTLSERSCYSYEIQEPIVLKWAITQKVYTIEDNILLRKGHRQYEIPLYK